MITKDSTQPQAPSPSGTSSSNTPAGEDWANVPAMSPRGPIEVAPDGSGTVNDPSGRDIKPPVSDGYEIPL
jgi:hypothetical protein